MESKKKTFAEKPNDPGKNNTAIIAYLTIIGLIIAFVLNSDKKEPFASYHIRQSLGLAVTGLTIGIIGLVPFIGWIINIIGVVLLIFMWVMGLMNALNGRKKPVPLLGEKFAKWFSSIQ